MGLRSPKGRPPLKGRQQQRGPTHPKDNLLDRPVLLLLLVVLLLGCCPPLFLLLVVLLLLLGRGSLGLRRAVLGLLLLHRWT